MAMERTVSSPLPTIAQRRKELKEQSRKLERRLDSVKEQLNELENVTYVGMTFKAVASDQRGRRAEFDLVLRDNPKYRILKEEIADLEYQHEDVEDLLSSINFKHRERHIQVLSRVETCVEKFTDAVAKFEAAVDRFTEARRKQ